MKLADPVRSRLEWTDEALAPYAAARTVTGGSSPSELQLRLALGTWPSAIVFDSDTDTGDSVSWEQGFFGGGTMITHVPYEHPTRPKRIFNVYISHATSDASSPPVGAKVVRELLRSRFDVWSCWDLDSDSWLHTELESKPAPGLSTAQLLARLKDQVALPVLDLASMIGLKRRRFYDLLDGQEPDPERIGVIYAVADSVDRIAELTGDRKKTASALVAPVLDARSFHEIASAGGEPASIRAAGVQLEDLLGGGMVVGSRPAPSLAPRDSAERTNARFTNAVIAGDD